MTITPELITLFSQKGTLNKTQSKILNITFPTEEDYKEQLLNKEISEHDLNKLILLKSIVAVTSQEQIVKNYQAIVAFKTDKKRENTEVSKPIKSSQNMNTSANISIYCDGACSGNPGKSGSGIALYKNNEKPLLLYGNYDPNGTNNTAELKALYKALQLADEINTDQKITILSDSKYSIDCISTWAYGWKKNNWTKKSGEIKNLELIKNGHTLYEKIQNNIILKHVKGHAGIEGNELADRMALHAIKAQNNEFEEYEYTNIQSIL